MRSASRALFSLFFPDECRICGQPLREIARFPVCRSCLSEAQPLSAEYFCVSCRTPFRNHFPLDFEGRCALCRSGLRGFDAAYCYGAYEGLLRDLIHLYKYGRIKTLARPLGGSAGGGAAARRAIRPDCARAAALDPAVAEGLQPVRSAGAGNCAAHRDSAGAAARARAPHAAQAGLSNTARRQNVAGAFRCRRGARLVAGKRILLIDDVMTTGSTAAACALALKRAGAERVALLTIARVDRRMECAARYRHARGSR